MKQKISSVILILGAVLLLGGIALAVTSLVLSHLGSGTREKALAEIWEVLPEITDGAPGSGNTDMPVLQVNGKDYAAVLEVPAFGVTLPVAADWDAYRLWECPRRFSGNCYDGSLVIGGQYDGDQFFFCDKIELGDTVTVTDMTGAQFRYAVSGIQRSSQADGLWLNDPDSQLTLFCRDSYSMEYIAVRCVAAY